MAYNSEHRLYRAKDGMVLGVCKGLSRYMGIPAFVLRLFFLILTFSTGFLLGAGLYILAAILMEPEPVLPPRNLQESDFYKRFRASRSSALQELQERIRRLDLRLQTMEDKVTRHGFDWDSRFRG